MFIHLSESENTKTIGYFLGAVKIVNKNKNTYTDVNEARGMQEKSYACDKL